MLKVPTEECLGFYFFLNPFGIVVVLSAFFYSVCCSGNMLPFGASRVMLKCMYQTTLCSLLPPQYLPWFAQHVFFFDARSAVTTCIFVDALSSTWNVVCPCEVSGFPPCWLYCVGEGAAQRGLTSTRSTKFLSYVKLELDLFVSLHHFLKLREIFESLDGKIVSQRHCCFNRQSQRTVYVLEVSGFCSRRDGGNCGFGNEFLIHEALCPPCE